MGTVSLGLCCVLMDESGTTPALLLLLFGLGMGGGQGQGAGKDRHVYN